MIRGIRGLIPNENGKVEVSYNALCELMEELENCKKEADELSTKFHMIGWELDSIISDLKCTKDRFEKSQGQEELF